MAEGQEARSEANGKNPNPSSVDDPSEGEGQPGSSEAAEDQEAGSESSQQNGDQRAIHQRVISQNDCEEEDVDTHTLKTTSSVSVGSKGPPTPPSEFEPRYGPLEQKVRPYARVIAQLLAPPQLPKRTLPHGSRGDFSLERLIGQHEKVFEAKSIPGRAKPISLRILIDQSGSMQTHIEQARQVAMTLLVAGEISKSEVLIWSFDTYVYPLASPHIPLEQSKAKISALREQGGTWLNPALETALKYPAVPNTLKVVVIICDGVLEQEDYQSCQVLAKNQLILPILIGEGSQAKERYCHTFGRAITPEPTCLVQGIRRWISSLSAYR